MKKSWIVIIIIFVVYVTLMIVLFGGQKDDKNKPTIQEKNEIKKYFYNDNNQINEISSNDKKELNKLQEEFTSLGIDDMDTFIPAKYTIKTLNEDNLKYFQKYISREYLNNLTVNQKIEFDFDDDGKNEQLILISNVGNDNVKKWITAVYYIDKKINIIKRRIYKEENHYNEKVELSNIVDLNGDGLYEIILKTTPPNEECYDVYKLNYNSVFKSVVLCEEPDY